jgi:N utilization substance protein A
VVVPDDQLSLAIGKEGQNARLAAKLTGWRIDIKSMSEAQGEEIRPDPITVATTKERDILAMAEAILLGKAAADADQTAVSEPEAVAEVAEAPVAEPTAAQEAPEGAVVAEEPEPRVEPSLLEQAQELLRDGAAAERAQEPDLQEAEAAVEAEVAVETEAVAQPVDAVEPEPEVAVAPEIEPEAEAAQAPVSEPIEGTEEPELESEPEPEPEPAQPERIILRRSTDQPKAKPKRRVRRPRFQYVRDERLESLDQPEKSKSGKKKRRLVVDEETGKLVQRPRHKHEEEQEWSGGES